MQELRPGKDDKKITALWKKVQRDVAFAKRIDVDYHRNEEFKRSVDARGKRVSHVLSQAYYKYKDALPTTDTSVRAREEGCEMLDFLPLYDYREMLHLVPELVNVVTLAEALPIRNSGQSLPLDLFAIAARSSNSYFAPKRFAAVQLAFSNPRCRVLIFHTGRIVGTGCDSPGAARLSIVRAQRHLLLEAGVKLHIRRFTIINQVAAAAIGARLDCDRFASVHSAHSHFDRESFVGLAWRPPAESCCCEIYSTGRANLPGSVRQYDLCKSWARMACHLYLQSDRPELVEKWDKHLLEKHWHDPSNGSRNQPAAEKAIDWNASLELDDEGFEFYDDDVDDFDDQALAELGL